MTQLLPATTLNIEQAAQIIRAGGLVAFPTETVYGLGANAYDENAVAKIFSAKGRPATDPLIVHIHSLDQLPALTREIPPLAYKLAEKFWAGALTLVLQKSERVPANVSAHLATVAVRMPNHPVALALLQAAGVPICAPSANVFARPSPTVAAHVWEDLQGRIDLILDGGTTTIGVESTIVDVRGETPVILRPGGITLEQLRAVAPQIQVQTRYVQQHEASPAPGMLLKHYSPRAALKVLRGDPAKVLAMMQSLCQEYVRQGQKVGVMATEAELAYFHPLTPYTVSLGSTLEEIAHKLFWALRALDQQGVDVILVRALEPEGLGLAILDRLTRAAEGHIIAVE